MKSTSWGTWIRTKINGVRVQEVPLLSRHFFSNQSLRCLLRLNGLQAIYKPQHPFSPALSLVSACRIILMSGVGG
jgi:hypothetical protein